MNKKIKQILDIVAIVGPILLIVGVGIWYEMEIWDECRATNSFWYCLRVLGK